MSTATSALIEAGHFALGFAEFDFFLQIVALIGVGFSFPYADFYFHAAVFPVDPEEGEGAAFDGSGVGEFKDFPLVEEQAARALGGVVEPFASRLPGLDVAAVEKDLIIFDAGVGVGNINFPGADRFDLSALEF